MKSAKSLLIVSATLKLLFTTSCGAAGLVFTNLASFYGTNGANPQAGLAQGQDGNFYGTTIGGGAFSLGTVFKTSPQGSLTTLVSFGGTNGTYPKAGLVQGTNGDSFFYGTTAGGGVSNLGTVFKISSNGIHTTLTSFIGTNGSQPQAALILSKLGTLHGTTYYGGTNSWPNAYGTVFQITTNGTLTNQFSFNNTNGAEPFASLMQGSDGNFYGTTQVSGAAGYGTVFKLTPSGITDLFSFNSTNGAFPLGGLAQGSDGKLYGTTYSGGASNLGTVFQITTNGIFTNLLSFSGTNGAEPFAGLLQGSDGNFYGATAHGTGPGGDTNGYGTIFQITSNGILTTLVSFDSTNGAYPLAALIQTADGSFYGTTANGGADGYGTVFR